MIKFETINCDGLNVSREFENVEVLQKEWDSEDCDIPSLDDEMVFAEIDRVSIQGETFNDFMIYLSDNYGFIM